MLVVQLAQAGGQLAAAGTGGSDHYQLPGGFNVFISAEALGADDVGSIRGITGDGIVPVDPDADALQTGLEGLDLRLLVESGQHHRADVQTQLPENINQADHIPVVGDAQIATNLVLLNVGGVDGNDHLHLILHLQQHSQLGVGLEAGQNTGGVVVIIQLAAEFQIQLATEL